MVEIYQRPTVAQGIGKVGKAIDFVGGGLRKIGRKFPERGLSEKFQSIGGTYGRVQASENKLPPAKNKINFPYNGPLNPNYNPNAGNPGGGGGSQDTSGGVTDYSSYGEPVPGYEEFDFDSMIAPALQGLDEMIAPLESEYGSNVQNIGARKQTALSGARQSFGAQEQGLEGNKATQNNMAESAADEARRQFSEIQQGIQARYGGTTGTGAFASEIASRDTLGNIGNIRQGLAQAIGEIDNKIQQVREIGRIAYQDIEDKANEQMSQAKNYLDTQLADIRRQKGELQSRKAEMAQNALQNYYQLKADIEGRNAQFRQNLYLKQVDAENALNLAKQKGKSTAESFKLYNLSQGQQMTPIRVGNRGSVQDMQGNPYQIGGGRVYNLGAPPDEEEEDIDPETGLPYFE